MCQIEQIEMTENVIITKYLSRSTEKSEQKTKTINCVSQFKFMNSSDQESLLMLTRKVKINALKNETILLIQKLIKVFEINVK